SVLRASIAHPCLFCKKGVLLFVRMIVCLHRIWCRMSFVNGVRDAFPEGADLLSSKRAWHGIRDDGGPHAHLGTALGEWRGGDPIEPLPCPILLKRTAKRSGCSLLQSIKHPLAQEWKFSAASH